MLKVAADPAIGTSDRALQLFRDHQKQIHTRTDRIFIVLMLVQWAFAIGAALWITPRTWAGSHSSPHMHVYAAIFLGGALAFYPIALALLRPGQPFTRHVVAVCQMLFSALLIHVTGGRIETHFHVFGSLAFLAFYRDWKVILPATIVVALDHCLRGYFWPEWVFGAASADHWRWLEHAAWVIFEDVFLVLACRQSVVEMKAIAGQRARLEATNEHIEDEVRKQTARLKASEEQYRHLFENHPMAMMVHDGGSGRILAANGSVTSEFGYSTGDLVTMRMDEIESAASVSHSPAGIDAAAGWHKETVYRRRDGTAVPVEVHAHKITFNGTPSRLIMANDISERKRAEQMLAVQYRSARVLARARANGEAAQQLLKAIGEMLDWPFAALWRVDSGGERLECVEIRNTAGPATIDFEVRSRNISFRRGEGFPGRAWESGRLVWVEDRSACRSLRSPGDCSSGLRGSVLVPVQSEQETLGILELLSPDPRSEDEKIAETLKTLGRLLGQFIVKTNAVESARKLADIVRSSEDAIISWTMDGVIDSWNSGAVKIYGYSGGEVIGRPVSLLHPPGEVEKVFGLLDVVRRGESAENVQALCVRRDGARIHVSMTASPIRNAEGVIVGVSQIARDVTEHLRLQEHLSRAQKLESIGQLAAGVAHEINTPAQYLGDNTRFLAEAFRGLDAYVAKAHELHQAARDSRVTGELIEELESVNREKDLDFLRKEVPSAIQQSQEGVDSISRIVLAMKEFSHPGNREMSLTDLNRAIDNTVTVARSEWRYVADLELDLDPGLPMIPCHPGEFNQAMLNMLVNAVHAIRDRNGDHGGLGRITIRSRHDADHVEVSIADTGTGIPEAIRAKIFDPFFTTKEVGKGTGQGLAITHDVIVNKLGGEILVQSEPGVGTTFIVRLKCADSKHNAD